MITRRRYSFWKSSLLSQGEREIMVERERSSCRIRTTTVDLGRESCVGTRERERERIFHTNRERKRESPEKEALKGDLFRGASFHFGPGCMLSGTSMDAFSIST
jgi:hypothetical protein